MNMAMYTSGEMVKFNTGELALYVGEQPMPPALVLFRLFAPEFSEVTDDIVKIWINLTIPLVSTKLFATVYSQALALLTAHRMKLAQLAENAANGIHPVNSISEGGASLSFGVSVASVTDDELYLTLFGKQFIELRNRFYIGGITG